MSIMIMNCGHWTEVDNSSTRFRAGSLERCARCAMMGLPGVNGIIMVHVLTKTNVDRVWIEEV